MSTQTAPPPSPGSAVKPYRLTVRQFLKAIEAGVFPHDVKIELLGGVLVPMIGDSSGEVTPPLGWRLTGS